MKRSLFALLLSAASTVALASAQSPGPGRPGEDPLGRFFFPPELVLQHAQELALQPGQRSTIVSAVKEAQGDLFDLQLLMSERSQELMKLLGGDPTHPVPGPERLDETAMLAQVDRILAVERDMKRRQLQLLIRIRNALTREQQEKLARYRDMAPGPRPDGAPF
jgi:Spy/CpxP family protein refolding chaperone